MIAEKEAASPAVNLGDAAADVAGLDVPSLNYTAPPPHDAPNGEWARWYAGVLAWPVFPVKVRGKDPLTAHGYLDATADPEQISAWWARWPLANIGLATGAASGVFVLDLDRKYGGLVALGLLEDELGPLPPTPRVRSGDGGLHHYLAYQPGIGRYKTGWPGVEVLGDGGYVILPPSVHPNGARYEWEATPW